MASSKTRHRRAEVPSVASDRHRLTDAQEGAEEARGELEDMAGGVDPFGSSLPDISVLGIDAQTWTQLGYKAAAGEAEARNIVQQVMTLGLAVMVTVVMLIVVGEFVAQTESTGAFNQTIDDVVSNAETAFGILAVLFLLVPVGAVIFYVRRMGVGGMGR
jgi:hypothetical protein